MAARWNPDQLLSITGIGRYGKIQCSGLNKGVGPRCGYQKWTSDADCIAIHRFLPILAAKPLSDITHEELLELAEYCLCRDWHYRQKDRVVSEWEDRIAYALSQQQAAIAPPRLQTPEPLVPRPQTAGAFGMLTPPSEWAASRPPSYILAQGTPPPALNLRDVQDTITSLQENIDTLQRERDDAHQDLENTRRELDNTRHELARANQNLAKTNNEIERKRGVERFAEDQAKAKARVEAELDSLKETHRNDIQSLRQELDVQYQSANELQQLEDERDQLSRKLSKAKQQYNALVNDLDAMQTNLERADQSRKDKEGELNNTQRELDEERRKRGEAEQTLRNSELELQQVKGCQESDAREWRNENAELKRRLQQLLTQAGRQTDEMPVPHPQSRLVAAQESGVGRELVLLHKPDGKLSWLQRLRGWIGRMRPGHPGRVSMRHEVV